MPLKTTHIISIDIMKTDTPPVVRMKQGDRLTREVTVNLLCDGSVWAAPSDVAVLQLAYCKSDKVGGCYDHMTDGSVAGRFNSARTAVTMQLHPQVLNVAGNVFCELRLLTNAGEILNTFNFIVNVQKSPIAMTLASEGYYNNVFDGATFVPHISEDGTVSWTNNKNLPNPEPVNVKGPKGDDGKSAYEFAVAGGYTGTPEQFAAEAAGIASSVKYTAQNHTEEEKAQARENIDAFSKNGGEIFGAVDVYGAVSAQRAVIVGENVTIRQDGVHGSNGTLNISSADDVLLEAASIRVQQDELKEDSVVPKKYVDSMVHAKAIAGLDMEGAIRDNYFVEDSANVVRGKFLDSSGNEVTNSSYLYYSLPQCVRGRTYRTGTSYIYSVIAEDSNGVRTKCTYESGSGKRTFTVPEADGDRIVKVYISLTANNYDAENDKSVIDITEKPYQDVYVPWMIAKSAKNIVQTEGDGENVAMSQKATTELLSSKIGRVNVLDALNIGAEPTNFFVDYTGRTPNPIQYNKVIDLSTHKIRDQSGYLVFPMTLYSGKTYELNNYFAATNRIYGNAFSLFNEDGTVTSIAVTDRKITVPVVENHDIVTIYGSISNGNYNNYASAFVCKLDNSSRYSGDKHLVPWIKTGNQWAGKNYLVIGDSVSAGTAPTGESYAVVEETFSKIVSDNLAMRLMNTAVQGRTVRTTLKTAQTGQSVMQDAIDAGFSPDLITILLGFNDYAAISRGRMTLGADEDVYTTPETCSYYAGLREIVRICQNTWKEATIIILTSNKCVDYHRKGHEVQGIKDIEAVKKEIAENFGVLFFDWTNICGFNTEDPDIVDYFRLDSIHPNIEAHRVLGNRLTGFVSSV